MPVTIETGISSEARAATGGAIPLEWKALSILLVVYVLNFMDRWVITILLQPIKEELLLTDLQLGLLNGFAYALLSGVAGIQLARLAERHNRVRILAICVTLWSLLTALSGMVGSFWQLVLVRMGVGIGEAGGLPTSHSLLADYFPPEKRTLAHAVFGLGLPIGGMLGMVLGGVLVDLANWRVAFIAVGIPGLLVAAIVRFWLKEPPRGVFDDVAGSVGSEDAPPLMQVVRSLWVRPTTRNIIIGLTLAVMFGNTGTSFLAPYMIREFSLSYSEVALLVGATNFLTAAIGMLIGGIITNRIGMHDRRWYMWIPAGAILLSIPFYLAGYVQNSALAMAAFLAPAGLIIPTYMAPSYATLHNLSQPRSRATITAITGICMGLIGAGMGPLLGGLTIDLFAEHLFQQAGSSGFDVACAGGLPQEGIAPAVADLCRPVLAHATQLSLLLWVPAMLWPAYHFWLASRTIRTEQSA